MSWQQLMKNIYTLLFHGEFQSFFLNMCWKHFKKKFNMCCHRKIKNKADHDYYYYLVFRKYIENVG